MIENANNRNEFMTLFEPAKDRLWRFCLSINYNREDAKEVLSQTVFEAYSNFAKLKNKGAFLGWLFTIAHRTNARLRKDKRRRAEIDPEYFDSLPAHSSAFDSSDVAELYTAMAQLPDEQREAIVLCEIMGFSREEAAEVLSSNADTVQKRIWRARKKLHELLSDDAPTPRDDAAMPRDDAAALRGRFKLEPLNKSINVLDGLQ